MKKKNDVGDSNDKDLGLTLQRDCPGKTYSKEVDINLDLQDKKDPTMINIEEEDSKYRKHKDKSLIEKIV